MSINLRALFPNMPRDRPDTIYRRSFKKIMPMLCVPARVEAVSAFSTRQIEYVNTEFI